MRKIQLKMRRLILICGVSLALSTLGWAAVRSDQFSDDPLKLKVPGQPDPEIPVKPKKVLNLEQAPKAAEEPSPAEAAFHESPAAVLPPPIVHEVGEETMAKEAVEEAAVEAEETTQEVHQLEQALDADPTPILGPELEETTSALPPRPPLTADQTATPTTAPVLDEFDQGVAQYKKTPKYLKNAFVEKDRFIFMSGNDNALHGGFVALFGKKHASSGDDEGRTLSLEAEYFYQAPYAEWRFFLETVGITQLDYGPNGLPRYTEDWKTRQFFLERDRVVVDLRRRHQYGTVYWLGGLLLEYWTDRGFLAKPIQKKWHKLFERQGVVQYFNMDRGVDETAFGTRSGIGLKELWNTAAYWDNILQGEIILEQMFSHKRRGSIGWRLDYTMTSGTWGGRNLSNPRLSLQGWGVYRRLFGGSDESQGGINLIYGLESKEKKVWRIILGVSFNREWEDRAFGKFDSDHAFWYLGVDVINFE